MNDEEIFKLLKGELQGPLKVCNIAPSQALRLGCRSTTVLLSHSNSVKIYVKHIPGERKVSRVELIGYLPYILKNGECRYKGPQEDKREALFFILPRQESGKYYKALVKSTVKKTELYLRTAHKINHDDYLQICKKTEPV